MPGWPNPCEPGDVPTINAFRRGWPAALAVTGLVLCAGCSNGSPTALVDVVPGRAAVSKPAVTGEACVQKSFGELTSAERAGQLVMVGVPIGTPGGQKTTVSKNHLGAVFLAGRSSSSPATIKRSVALLPAQHTAHSTIGLLVSVDQEGGEVQSLRGGSWTTIPAATVQGTWSAATLTSRTKAWVSQLKSAGLTMDLAPVADTVPAGSAKLNPPIGAFNRQFGSSSAVVARSITTVTSAMKGGGVIPTVKHFPGLGRVRYNTDTSTKAVDTKTTVTDPYLRPFQAGITAGAGAVMVSSATYTKIDSHNLAVFSSAVITSLLRTRMKYQGVVMTDDVGRAVAVKSVPTGDRAVRFITAGGDLVLTVVTSQAATMVNAIVAEAKSSASFRAKVNASTVRVLRLKEKSGLLHCT